MIDREHGLPITRQAEVLHISPWQHLLSAAASVGSRPRADATARRAASGVPFRREPDAARSSGCRGMQGGPSACEDADEADGDRGALSPPAHHQARAWPQDLPVSTARPGDHAAEPGLGDGHHVYPDGARLRLSGRRARLGEPPRAGVEAVDHDGSFLLRRDAGGCSARHGKPEVFNTDQGSQFTGTAFTGVLANNDIAISMDGKGAWRDNVFVERLWRSVKYEEVYLRAYDGVSEARRSIGRYLDFYNRRRHIRALTGRHPIKPTSPRCPLRLAA